MRRCKHCEQPLDNYEKNCKYCLPCFDLWKKSRLEIITEIEKQISKWKVLVGSKDYIAGYEEFRDSLLLMLLREHTPDLLKDMREELE